MHNPSSSDIQVKKRRMDWDSLDLNATNNSIVIESQNQQSLPKVSNFTVAKDNRERKKVAQNGKYAQVLKKNLF